MRSSMARPSPADEALQEALLRRAALAMQAMTWKGKKTSSEQALAWPRRGVHLDGENKPSNYLPARIQYGQMALAVAVSYTHLTLPTNREV